MQLVGTASLPTKRNSSLKYRVYKISINTDFSNATDTTGCCLNRYCLDNTGQNRGEYDRKMTWFTRLATRRPRMGEKEPKYWDNLICSNVSCSFENNSLVGGHVIFPDFNDTLFLIPICSGCNGKKEKLKNAKCRKSVYAVDTVCVGK